MSYGKSKNPCPAFKYWFANPGLCGVCAWEKDDHNSRNIHGLQDYQIRVVHELRDLEEKIEKLRIFIASNKFANVEGLEQGSMMEQSAHMINYAKVLRKRIDAFLPELESK